MNERSWFGGKVVHCVLPLIEPPAASNLIPKRLALPQGELAQLYDSEEGLHYLAFIELRAGAVRGNHFHRRKEEYLYVIEGELELIVEELEAKQREIIRVKDGEMVVIQPGVPHALKTLHSGQGLEFSKTRYDAADVERYVVI